MSMTRSCQNLKAVLESSSQIGGLEVRRLQQSIQHRSIHSPCILHKAYVDAHNTHTTPW